MSNTDAGHDTKQEKPAKTLPGIPKAVDPTSALFIFIGDPNDSGFGPRAESHDDEEDEVFDSGPAPMRVYGLEFPYGKAVSVPLDARVGNAGPAASMSIVDKLRGNSHFFEGDEEALATAKRKGVITFKKAPRKTNVLTKYKGMKMKKGATKPDTPEDD